MLNPGLPFHSPSWDPAAQTAFSAMVEQPSSDLKLYYNRFVVALKAAGGGEYWTKADAVHLFATHTAQAALLNLKNPGTNDAVLLQPTTPVTFTPLQGFTTDGVDNAVQLLNPTTGGLVVTQTSMHFGARSRTAGQLATATGWHDGTDGTRIAHLDASDDIVYGVNQAAATTIGTPTVISGAALVVANRSTNTANQVYQNGVAQTATLNANQTSTALNNSPLYLGRASTSVYIARQWASAYVGMHCDVTKQGRLSNADLAFMQSVGAA